MAFIFIWKICVCLFVHTVPYAAYEENLFATKGQHFQTTLKKHTFFKDENNIEFTVSLDEMPDLPMWMKFEQKDAMSDGILYGTPDDDARTIGLAIIGWNKETYETFHKVVMLSVLERAPNITHQIEMKIKDKGATDLLKNGHHFLKIVNNIWHGAQHITFVERPTLRGIKTDKDVFIGIAGNTMYPKELKVLKENCDKKDNKDNIVQRSFVDSGYDIDWCVFKDLKEDAISDTQKFDFDENSKYFDAVLTTTKWDDTTSDLTLDIIYVFIAVFIGLLLIAFITCIMFFNREGLQQRNNLTPKQQLLHHKALRRAGAQIRNMSGKDEERNGFPYGKLDEDSRCGTLSSNKQSEKESSPSPPPYRNDSDHIKRQDSKF